MKTFKSTLYLSTLEEFVDEGIDIKPAHVYFYTLFDYSELANIASLLREYYCHRDHSDREKFVEQIEKICKSVFQKYKIFLVDTLEIKIDHRSNIFLIKADVTVGINDSSREKNVMKLKNPECYDYIIRKAQ